MVTAAVVPIIDRLLIKSPCVVAGGGAGAGLVSGVLAGGGAGGGEPLDVGEGRALGAHRVAAEAWAGQRLPAETAGSH